MPVVADARGGYGYATCTLPYAQAWFDNHMLSSRVVVQLQQVSARMSHMLMLGSLAYSVPLIPGEEGKHYITLHYKTLFCSKFALKAMDDRTKGKLYEALVLGILLYGSETWALTTPNRQKLNKFHNSCVRYLCGARRRTHQRQHTPTMASLFAKLHVHNMDHYLNARYLRWAGHVARMPEHRLPRRMLTAWVDNPRPRGKSCYGYGHWLEKELNAAGICTEANALAMGNVESWMQQAQDRVAWRRVSISNRMRYSSSNKVPTELRGSGIDAIDLNDIRDAINALRTRPAAVCTRVLRSHGRRDNIT